MARFADLIGSISEPTPAPAAERLPESQLSSTHVDVTTALASLAAPPTPPAPDPTSALVAAFGTVAADPKAPSGQPAPPVTDDEVDTRVEFNDDLLPSRPAKGRRR